MLELIEDNVPTKTNMSLTQLLDLPPSILESIQKSIRYLKKKDNAEIDNLENDIKKLSENRK
jgi:hypothetical protein